MCPKEDNVPEEKIATSPEKKVTAKKAKFEEVAPEEGMPPKVSNIEGILDVPMEVSVRLGKTSMSIQELLNTGPGSIVELDSIAGGTVDILINNRIFARGEIIVIEERFGVRITALINPEERIQQLGK
ncbi:MAG: flagellar motor switch protein FliN [bacterium]|nr:flagellar motor switch protein FliN [bacterium]